MTLHKQITQKLEQVSHDEVLRDMGYHNLKTGHKTLQKFLDTSTIYLWLKTGNFDMRYDPQIVTIKSNISAKEIEKAPKPISSTRAATIQFFTGL